MSRQITFHFPLRATSFQQNQFVKYKTPLQRDFERRILFFLRDRSEDMKAFREAFVASTDALESSWAFLYTDFFTKKDNSISARCLDLDNSTKNIQDTIFKHGLEMNDSLIVRQQSFKWKAAEDAIILRLKIVKRDEIEEKLQESINELFT